ncbi:hypothetical protein AB0M91_28760 [Micromonospora rifamycinica]|uniref:hypothetical protein n=1 Tax=Micromonospora rifamycinica TaxID=291594 RepID=UPI0033F6EB76
MKLLFEASAPVRARLADVRRLIDTDWVPDTVLGQAGRAYVDVDHRDGVVGFQGHWWYRGEISASAPGGHTVITCRVFNVARRGAWAVPLANKLFIGYDRTVRDTAADLARAIQSHLVGTAS